MKVDVYKRTSDNWYPSYKSDDGDLVAVSFVKTGPSDSPTDFEWRVCAWGNDDCGMEKDFPPDQESAAWTCFLEVIGLEFVNMKDLKSLGFVSA